MEQKHTQAHTAKHSSWKAVSLVSASSVVAVVAISVVVVAVASASVGSC